MAVSEESRHELFQRLEQVLGAKQAATLMEHLPPVGWAHVATRRDLDALEARLTGAMDRRFGEIDRRFGEMDRRFGEMQREFGEMHLQMAEWGRTVLYVNLGAVLATASLAFAAAKLA
jgi:hypothetical protein